MRDIEIIPIEAVGGTAGKTVEVVVSGSGRVLRLPVSQIEMWPGRVVVPGWLYRKISKGVNREPENQN